jgi:hypothetical protein
MFTSTLNQPADVTILKNNRNETIARKRGNRWLSSSNQPIAETTIHTLSSKPGYTLS